MLRRLRWILWMLVIVTLPCVVFVALRNGRDASGAVHPSFGSLPEFQLVAQDGRAVTGADLRGKVTIWTFIFTRCTESCPLQTARMATLQHDLAEESDLRLVSVTVDPEYDTPAVLQAYGAHAGADPHRWVFLTGEPQAIWRFMGDALRLPFVAGRTATPTTIAHTGGLLLVDRDLGVRGYYGGQDSAELQSLSHDAIALLHKRQPAGRRP